MFRKDIGIDIVELVGTLVRVDIGGIVGKNDVIDVWEFVGTLVGCEVSDIIEEECWDRCWGICKYFGWVGNL